MTKICEMKNRADLVKIKLFLQSQIDEILRCIQEPFDLLVEGSELEIRSFMRHLEIKSRDIQLSQAPSFVSNGRFDVFVLTIPNLTRAAFRKLKNELLLLDGQGYLRFNFLFKNQLSFIILTHDADIIRK